MCLEWDDYWGSLEFPVSKKGGFEFGEMTLSVGSAIMSH